MNVNNQYNLQELFKELKEKEGVESIDDVLKKVISPNGISFNEIKPVYRELLLKLAMTMSQDELFQRSKNIMSAEKKKTTKKKDKASKKSYPVSASEQSTLSSFLKLTFSSNKHQNGMGTEKSSTFTKDSKKSISKTDISGPMPIHPPPSLGRKTPKTTRKATSPLPPPPSPPKSHPPSTQIKTKKPPIPTDDFIDDAYVSCSECNESSCIYDSCSVYSTTGPNHSPKKIPPPKGYQGHVIKAQVHHHAHDENDSIHDCDTDSCISSEKCYCSLRKDPRSTATTTPKLRPKLAPIPSDSDSCCGNHFTTSEMSDSATDTTCYSVRHVPIVKHNHSSAHMSLSGAETPQTAWRRNSKSISNDISSDTYSDAGIMLNSSASSSGSCKMCEVHHKMHHHTSDDDHSNLSRKNSGNSGGSGYQSNDSTCCSHHCGGSHSGSGSPHSRPITSASSIACSQCPPSSCSSCQTSLAGSLMSTRRSRPKLSLPYSHSNINLSAAGLGSPMDMERSSRGRSSSPQKMLVVSAMDRSGKVRNNQNTREPPLVRKLSLSARKVQELSAGRELEEDCKICERQYKMRV